MSQAHARIDRGGNDVRKAGPGDMVMDQKKRFTASPMTLAGNQVIPAVAILSGIIVRTGPGAGYADAWDSADNILAACPDLNQGDSFEFLFDNTGTAFANTSTAGAGITLVSGSVTASLCKRFLLTVLAAGRSNIQAGITTNGSAVVSFFNAATGFPSQGQANTLVAKNIQPGMLVTGTGIPASTTVVAVNASAGTITLSANATATSAPTTALTFTPNIEIRGLYQAAA